MERFINNSQAVPGFGFVCQTAQVLTLHLDSVTHLWDRDPQRGVLILASEQTSKLTQRLTQVHGGRLHTLCTLYPGQAAALSRPAPWL